MNAPGNPPDPLAPGRDAVLRGSLPVLSRRKKNLKILNQLLLHSEEAAASAYGLDLGRSRKDFLKWEWNPLRAFLRHLIRDIGGLLAPAGEHPFPALFAGQYRLPEPCGQVLVAGEWESPFLRTLAPALAAYAAGNSVVLKPSLRTPRVLHYIEWLLPQCFSPAELFLAGDELPLGKLLMHRFDRIYPGSASEYRSMLSAAAEQGSEVLTLPCGKRPCIIAGGASLRKAADQLAQSCFLHAGQYRTSPDCLWVQRPLRDRFCGELRRAVARHYGKDPLETRKIPPLADVTAYENICQLMEHGRLILGGNRQPERRLLEPTVVDRLPDDDSLWQKEINGPVLPLAEFETPEELLSRFPSQERCPVLYCFGGDRRFRSALQNRFHAAELVFDDAPCCFGSPGLPGAAHREKQLVCAFLREKTVYRTPFPQNLLDLFRP